jgi:methylated-DNA-[protein]-cysteine S-methyltransferase
LPETKFKWKRIMSAVAQVSLHSPVGDISVSEEDGYIVSVDWGWGRDQTSTPLLKETIRQLNAYFDGALKKFDLPLRPEGTKFQKAVWKEMLKIPYGRTLTYGDIASRLNSAPRAVGGACGRNNLPILIPCHRVLGANDALVGYTADGGLVTKTTLLILEGKELQLPQLEL